MFTEADAKEGLKAVMDCWGKDTAARIEQLSRVETAHYTSKGYQLTGTGGMEKHGEAPYYGWDEQFFKNNPQYSITGTVHLHEGAGLSKEGGNAQQQAPKEFVVFNSVEGFMMFLADYAMRHVNEGGLLRWYSTDKQMQAKYSKVLDGVKARIVATF